MQSAATQGRWLESNLGSKKRNRESGSFFFMFRFAAKGVLLTLCNRRIRFYMFVKCANRINATRIFRTKAFCLWIFAIIWQSVLPVYEYTQGLPVPPGRAAWAAMDTEHKNCSVNLTVIRESDYNEYLEILKQAGFSVIENTTRKAGEKTMFLSARLCQMMKNG